MEDTRSESDESNRDKEEATKGHGQQINTGGGDFIGSHQSIQA